ncbi:MAG TPA: hypothetical protein VJP85_11085 [Candidatus Baltobacteraceae bacterium]|nr:hypothetical protein [Candidatus Baltobacteraceae bacterium]
MNKALVALCAAGLLAGCSSGGGTTAQSAAQSTPPALENPTGFPLYSGAKVVSAKSYTQIVHADTSSENSVFAQGNGTYAGHEVVASSPASFSALSTWLDGVNASPPAGFTAEEPQTNPDREAQAQRYGLDYAVFKRKTGAQTRGVLVIVMDPQRVNQRFGTILGMIDKYKALPSVLRGPIDDQAKARFGMTVTQATQPDSPIGAALAALGELEHRNARGIVVLDALKQ